MLEFKIYTLSRIQLLLTNEPIRLLCLWYLVATRGDGRFAIVATKVAAKDRCIKGSEQWHASAKYANATFYNGERDSVDVVPYIVSARRLVSLRRGYVYRSRQLRC